MSNENKIRKVIRKHLFESINMGEAMIDEERITNDEAKEHVKNKENFVGSHIFGEKIGDDYVVCSYGKQFPLFIFSTDDGDGKWYENGDEYLFNGEPIEQTSEHRDMMRPSVKMYTQPLNWMTDKLHSMMKKAGISELSHTSVEPGEKN